MSRDADGPPPGGRQDVMPTSVTPHVSVWDRFAGWASATVSRAWFFAFCVALVVVWAPTYFLLRDLDTWQLIINTATTIITFLLVALLQNSQQRADQATQHKLNAMAQGLADLMTAVADDNSLHPKTTIRLKFATRELRAAVGLEQRESS
jgi:low affinity Fe/Cu permease